MVKWKNTITLRGFSCNARLITFLSYLLAALTCQCFEEVQERWLHQCTLRINFLSWVAGLEGQKASRLCFCGKKGIRANNHNVIQDEKQRISCTVFVSDETGLDPRTRWSRTCRSVNSLLLSHRRTTSMKTPPSHTPSWRQPAQKGPQRKVNY